MALILLSVADLQIIDFKSTDLGTVIIEVAAMAIKNNKQIRRIHIPFLSFFVINSFRPVNVWRRLIYFCWQSINVYRRKYHAMLCVDRRL